MVGFARDADHAPDSLPGPQQHRFRTAMGDPRPNQEGAYEVLGVGTISCEVWTKDRADKNNDRNFINVAWVQGYLTAVNVFGDGPSHLAKGTDAEGIMTWIDNYCAQHPGHSLTVAAKALVNELTEKATP